MSSRKKEEVKTLQQIWYQKLKDQGFIDIEDTSHKDSPLLDWHSFRFRNTPPEKIQYTLEYYAKARSLLHTYKFPTSTHRLIWELHSEGVSKYKIEKAIKTSARPYKRESIALIITLIAREIK